jgi:hypothetical protein
MPSRSAVPAGREGGSSVGLRSAILLPWPALHEMRIFAGDRLSGRQICSWDRETRSARFFSASVLERPDSLDGITPARTGPCPRLLIQINDPAFQRRGTRILGNAGVPMRYLAQHAGSAAGLSLPSTSAGVSAELVGARAIWSPAFPAH